MLAAHSSQARLLLPAVRRLVAIAHGCFAARSPKKPLALAPLLRYVSSITPLRPCWLTAFASPMPAQRRKAKLSTASHLTPPHCVRRLVMCCCLVTAIIGLLMCYVCPPP